MRFRAEAQVAVLQHTAYSHIFSALSFPGINAPEAFSACISPGHGIGRSSLPSAPGALPRPHGRPIRPQPEFPIRSRADRWLPAAGQPRSTLPCRQPRHRQVLILQVKRPRLNKPSVFAFDNKITNFTNLNPITVWSKYYGWTTKSNS